jgi:subtilisin family serine protease
MQLKLIKKTNNNLLLLLGITLFIFAQNAIIINGFSQNSDIYSEPNLLEENIPLKDSSSIDNLVNSQLKVKEVENTYILKISNVNQKLELLQFLERNNYKTVDYLENLGILIIKSSYNEIIKLTKRFQVTISNNEKWQGIPDLKDPFLLDYQQENGVVYENPRTTINIGLLSETGTNTNIAILDTGLDTSHRDFENILARVEYQESFVSADHGYTVTEEDINDLNGHGTHVAGIAAGSGSVNSMYLGVAPNAKLTILKIGSSLGQITSSGLLAAIETAINRNADIISLSVGFFPSDPDNILSLAVDKAVAKGVSVVIAAGNSGSNNGTTSTPASSRLSISVGAYDTQNKNVADFSSRGLSSDGRIDPDIVAPGVNIIAPLASNSVSDWSVRWFDPTPIFDSNYIGFSGTSMSAPVVAGAIALLLERYPDLNPMTIRTALTKTAKDLGNPENVQGAGLIDIQAAMNYIDSNQEEKDVWDYLPKKGVLMNSQIPRILFPTEEYTLRMFVTSSISLSISVELLDANANANASLSKAITIFEENKYDSNNTFGAYTEFVIKINPQIGGSLGKYSGSIKITINDSPHNLLSIGTFTVKNPDTNIYWSSYHSSGTDYPNSNFQLLDTILRKNSVYTVNFNKILEYYALKQYDIVILTEPESTLFLEEINALVQYVEEGGNLMIWGSYYPFTNNDNLNTISNQFGVEFLTKTFWDVEDDGIQQSLISPDPLSLELNLSEIDYFSSVSELSWFDGSMLDIFSNDIITLASITIDDFKYPVEVLFDGNSTIKGKILLSGQSLNFKDNNLDLRGNDSLYLLNIIKNFESNDLKLKIVMNSTEIKKDSTELFSIRVFENNQQLILDGSTSLNVTIIDPNNSNNKTINYDTATDQFVLNQTFGISGIYNIKFQYGSINKTLSLKVYETEVTIDITMENDGGTIVDSGKYPGYLTEDSSFFVSTYGLKIKFIVNSTSNKDIKAAITFVPEVFYGISGTVPKVNEIFSNEIEWDIKNGFVRTFTLTVSENLPVGFYLFQIYQEVEDIELLTGNTSSLFLIVDRNPQIDLSKSTVKGNEPFSNYEFSEEDEEPKFLTVFPGEEISFDIQFQGSEKSSSFHAAIIYTPYFTFLDLGYIFDTEFLNQKEENRITGTYTIPENTTIELANFNIILENDNVLSLFVVVWDDLGNYDLFIFYVSLQRDVFSSFQNLILPFFAIILFPMIFLFVMMYRSSKKRKDQDVEFRLRQEQRMMTKYRGFSGQTNLEQQFIPQQPVEQEIFTPKFCGNCGSPSSPGETFCMECGKKIN